MNVEKVHALLTTEKVYWYMYFTIAESYILERYGQMYMVAEIGKRTKKQIKIFAVNYFSIIFESC